jgi:hypothetical protein
MSKAKLYDPIDVHSAPKVPTWPEVIPAMTDKGAVNAASRLFRWAIRRTFEGAVYVTRGNRRAFRIDWDPQAPHRRAIFVNPSKGWRDFAHDASHYLDWYANGKSEHGKHHAKFEARLIAEIVRRGWLDEKPEPPVVTLRPVGATQRLKLQRIEERIKRWETKAKRAKTALAKLAKQRRYYERALFKAVDNSDNSA